MLQEILMGTPWWVYLLLIYLVFRGVKALKPQIVSVKKIFILPLIFCILSLYRLISTYQGFRDLIVWLFFIIIGYIVGWGLAHSLRIRIDRRKLLLRMPGSPIILVLVLLVFATRYFFGAYSAMHPDAKDNFLFHSANLLSSGFITGIFLGRFFAILKKAGKAKHTKLKVTK